MTQNHLNNKLITASKTGNLKAVKSAIEQGANIHTHDDYALRWASKYNHKEIVKYLKKVMKKEKVKKNNKGNGLNI